MKLSSEWIDYKSNGESASGYRVHPAAATEPLPAVIVIQELWGPDAHICDVADRFATAGYLAIAPDLYSIGRQPAMAQDRITAAKKFLDSLPPGLWGNPEKREVELEKQPEPLRTELSETLEMLFASLRDMGQFVRDLEAAIDYLQQDPSCNGKVASVGFCLGGTLSGQLACAKPELSSAVIFYGSAPPEEKINSIQCPVLGIYGSEDTRIMAGVPDFVAAMETAGKSFHRHVYAGAPHAFFNDTRPSYHVSAARDAWARTLTHLADTLS